MPPKSCPSPVPSSKLLVIDDDASNLELVSAALEQEGLDISAASDPEEGLDTFSQVRPAIVLVDLMMPKMSGLEAQCSYKLLIRLCWFLVLTFRSFAEAGLWAQRPAWGSSGRATQSIRPMLLHHLVVITHDQERGCPLSHE